MAPIMSYHDLVSGHSGGSVIETFVRALVRSAAWTSARRIIDSIPMADVVALVAVVVLVWVGLHAAKHAHRGARGRARR